MTTIAKDFAAKLAVAFVAVAMVFAAYAPAANAQTTEDLQQMINDLLAQVAQLQGQLGEGGSTPAAGVCPYTWTRDLSSGSTGGDVMNLQKFLNADPDTRVAVSGAGSAGMETDYYGPATAAAVSKFQVKYRADVLSPFNLVNPTGYFGPSSRGKANALCIETAVEEDVDEDMDEDEDEDEDEDMTLGGEASLDVFEVNDGESSIEEGDEEVAVAELTVEFTDGDAEISRIDVELTADSGNTEKDPWDVFETVSLWVDGDMIAEENADDEDDYLNEDDGSLRFSGLDLIAMEDEEVEIVVAVTVQNNLDGMPSETWNITAESMRFFDADGVATTIDSSDSEADEMGDLVEFDIEEAGADEELDISTASSNPDAADIVVDTDDDTNDVTIMVTELEAQDNDLELNRVVVLIETDGASTTAVVDEAYVVIDGQTFSAESVESAHSGSNPDTLESRFDNADEQGVWYVFDIDGDVVLDEDDQVDMEVVVDLNDTNDGNRYSNGQTIKATVGSFEKNYWEAEGAEDLDPSDFNGTSVGDEHILVAEGILLPRDGVSTDESTTGDNDQTGQFTIEFEVTAVEGDFYITDTVEEDGGSATSGVKYLVDGPFGTATTSGVLSSTADEDTSGVFTVRDGETETFTLTVTVDTDTTGQHRVTLTEVNYTDEANGVGGAGSTYTPTPAQDFRTAYTNVNAN